MTQKELKQHLLSHRDDLTALRELKSRPKQTSVTVGVNTSKEEQMRILKEIIGDN